MGLRSTLALYVLVCMHRVQFYSFQVAAVDAILFEYLRAAATGDRRVHYKPRWRGCSDQRRYSPVRGTQSGRPAGKDWANPMVGAKRGFLRPLAFT
jgi:hypothetical protein